MYVRGLIIVRRKEDEECVRCCMRFMMVSCEMERMRNVEDNAHLMSCGGLAALVLFRTYQAR